MRIRAGRLGPALNELGLGACRVAHGVTVGVGDTGPRARQTNVYDALARATVVEFRAVLVFDALDAVAGLLVAKITGCGTILVRSTARNACVLNAGVSLLAIGIGVALHTVAAHAIADRPLGAIQGVGAGVNAGATLLGANLVLAALFIEKALGALP